MARPKTNLEPLDSDADDLEFTRYDVDSVVATLPGVVVRTGGGLVILEGETREDRFVFTIPQVRSLIVMSRPRDPAFSAALEEAIKAAKGSGVRSSRDT